MKVNKGSMSEGHSSHGNRARKTESHRVQYHKDVMPGSELWTDGLICAFEFVRGDKKFGPKSSTKGLPPNEIDNEIVKRPARAYRLAEAPVQRTNGDSLLDSTSLVESREQEIYPVDGKMDNQSSPGQKLYNLERIGGSHWMPIGWARISELIQTVQADIGWSTQQFDLIDDEDDLTVADLAAPYWERPAGPIWWCHVTAGHPSVDAWLSNAPWLHPAISVALRDEGRLISEKMKHLLYEVPVRVAGGLLFELLGQSAGDPYVDEDDIPVVIRSWQAQNFLITVLHVKGSAKNLNVLGITEVQEQLLAGGYNAPRTVHEVIAHLASRLARWDDREEELLLLVATYFLVPLRQKCTNFHRLHLSSITMWHCYNLVRPTHFIFVITANIPLGSLLQFIGLRQRVQFVALCLPEDTKKWISINLDGSIAVVCFTCYSSYSYEALKCSVPETFWGIVGGVLSDE